MIIGINIVGQLNIVLTSPFDEEDYLPDEQILEILLGLQNGDYVYSMTDQSILDVTTMKLICNTIIVGTESLEYEYVNNN